MIKILLNLFINTYLYVHQIYYSTHTHKSNQIRITSNKYGIFDFTRLGWHMYTMENVVIKTLPHWP